MYCLGHTVKDPKPDTMNEDPEQEAVLFYIYKIHSNYTLHQGLSCIITFGWMILIG